MVDDAARVVRIVFALNRVWQPTLKRIADRTAALTVKPERLRRADHRGADRTGPRRALLVMTELQVETLALAPDGPNVDRARKWLSEGRGFWLSTALTLIGAGASPRPATARTHPGIRRR